jgi:CCR4-NOT transcription complex subunit 1
MRIKQDPLIIYEEQMLGKPLEEVEEDMNAEQEQIPEGFEENEVLEKVNVKEATENFPDIEKSFLETLANTGIMQAMKDIRDPVIRRVIPITLITTRLLILKDFALEPDPEKLKEAAISTSTSVAGMLAQITCKEPLKHQLARSLKDLVLQSEDSHLTELSDEERKELAEMIIRENLDIGCKRIQSEIQKEALDGILKEDSILEAIHLRQRAKEEGKEYRDFSNKNNFNKLPDLLKPSENGLTDIEFQVYKDFDDIPNVYLESEIAKDVDRILEDEEENAENRPSELRGASIASEDNTKYIINQKFEQI